MSFMDLITRKARAGRRYCTACGKWLGVADARRGGGGRCKECRRAQYYGEGDPKNGRDE